MKGFLLNGNTLLTAAPLEVVILRVLVMYLMFQIARKLVSLLLGIGLRLLHLAFIMGLIGAMYNILIDGGENCMLSICPRTIDLVLDIVRYTVENLTDGIDQMVAIAHSFF